MFERFTDRARNALHHAEVEAKNLGHDHVHPAHILVGLIREGRHGVAETVLRDLGVGTTQVQAIRDALVKVFPGTKVVPSQSKLPYTPEAKTVIERSIVEASGLGHNYIGTEHLLLGLTHDVQATGILLQFGVASGDVRKAVVKLFAAERAGDKNDDEPPQDETPRVWVPIGTLTQKPVFDFHETGVSVLWPETGLGFILNDADALDLKVFLTLYSGQMMSRRRKVLEADKAKIDKELATIYASEAERPNVPEAAAVSPY